MLSRKPTRTLCAGLLYAGAAAALMAAPIEARAAAFYLQEQSVSGLGSAFSGGTSNTHDASTVYYNPAGMTMLEGTQTQIGVINIAPTSSLTDLGSTLSATGNGAAGGSNGGNPYDTINLIPHAYLSHQLNDRIWVGFAATTPYGLAEEYDKGWFARYNSTKTQLRVIDLAPSIAYKINNQWSVGAGIDFQYAMATLESNPSIGTTSIVSRLNGHDWATGANIGVQFHPTPATDLGMTYRSQVNHDLKGSITTSGASNTNSLGHANLNLPDQVTFGGAQKLNDQWTIQGQASWFNWSRFHDITAHYDSGALASQTIEDYKNTWSFATGAEYKYNDKWTFRGGVQYDQTPTGSHRDTRVPDGNRTWLAGGTTYNLTPAAAINFSAAYIWMSKETINLTTASAGALGTETVRAGTSGHVILTGLDLSYKF